MNNKKSIRKDWKLIESLIKHNSRVLDIGCGEGGLIAQLANNIQAKTNGIEVNPELTRKAIASGYNVVQGNAEKDLLQYSNQSFDYVILSQTLQAMIRPKEVLLELLRIGGKAIVSFPNFGHWRIRLQLLLTGKMPITKGLPYAWYETPNIHFFTIKDFQNLCKELNIIIEKSIALTGEGRQFEISSGISGANLFTSEAIFLLSYQNFKPIKIKSEQKSFANKSAVVS
jgi:methionine biosynthesis protein MetW